MPITEEQRQRAEANRLAALAKRKAFADSNSTINNQQQHNPWRFFKCRKLQQNSNTHLPVKFKVRLEICSPDSFSITPLAIQGFLYPGEPQCLMWLSQWLSDVLPTRYTQNHGGGKACVYKLRDYDSVTACLKNYREVEIEKIPFGTLNVVQRLSNLFETGRWEPCRPEHLTDEKVDELIRNLPKKLLDSLLPFQYDGLKFGLQRGGRCLIADEMGLGKTLQAIAIAGCFIGEGPILVVCPAILRFSWAEELERWLPSCLPSEIHLVFGHRDNPVHLAKFPRVVVISYKMLHHLRKSIIKREWALLIIDESHHLRCTKKRSEPEEVKAVLDITANIKRIVLLSGTPSLSRPGLLGQDKYDFAKTYCSVRFVQPSEGKGFQDFSKGTRLEELNVLLRQTVMIRRLKEHVLQQLPPKRRQIIRLLLKRSDIVSAKAAVGSTNGDVSECNPAEAVNEETLDEPNDSDGCCKSTKLSNQELGIAKLSGFREWLSIHPLISESDVSEFDGNLSSQKMIIFAHHHKVLDGVQEFLCEKHVGFIRIDGNTLPQDRQSAVLSFKSSDEVKIAIIGVTAGGVGLDFSSAQNVVFLELPLTPSLMLQAEDRAHRRGQTNAVNIYIFCAKDTMDERHWQNLNKSLHRVSSTTNGKYDAVPEIAVDGVSYLETSDTTKKSSNKQASETASSSPFSALESVELSDSEIMQDKQLFEKHESLLRGLIEIEQSSSVEHTVYKDGPRLKSTQHQLVGQANLSGYQAIEKELAKGGQLEGSIPELGSVTNELSSYDLDKHDATKDRLGQDIKLCPLSSEVDNDGAFQRDDVDPNSCDQVAFLRFEVSRYTGRIHLYSCIPGVDTRPRPLCENVRQEEIESHAATSNKNKETASASFLDNPAYRLALFEFLKEWNQLRPIEKRKLVGKTLQLPLSIELCYLNENNNHNSGGLLKGGSNRRTTPWQEISHPLPPNAAWKNINLSSGRDKKEKQYTQAWTSEDEPLCKLCQKPCMGSNAKTPEYLEDLFCNLSCYEEYRIRTSGRFLRQELFQIEHGICTNCRLDCHKLVKAIQPLSVDVRREYIERVAPKVASRKKLLEKLVNDPSEGNAWHADHIVPVYRGGGECRLENMRTLCVACHYDVTKAQCAERRIARAMAKKQLKEIMGGLRNQKLPHTDGCLKVQDDNFENELFVKVPGSFYSKKEDTAEDSKDLSDVACQAS